MDRPAWHPSPNFGPRRDGAIPDMVVLHYTGMESCDAARDRLCDDGAEVSAHYLVSETGHIVQMVDESMRAWHAGAGQWGNVTDVNSRSIGIELANSGAQPFPEPQMAALEALLTDVLGRHTIPAHRVIGHSDMAPARKHDPGPRFDWRRLARRGLSVWPAQTDTSQDFDRLAARFGYPVAPDATPVLAAFRHRFRPWATGPQDATDLRLIADLAQRFPFDAETSAA